MIRRDTSDRFLCFQQFDEDEREQERNQREDDIPRTEMADIERTVVIIDGKVRQFDDGVQEERHHRADPNPFHDHGDHDTAADGEDRDDDELP